MDATTYENGTLQSAGSGIGRGKTSPHYSFNLSGDIARNAEAIDTLLTIGKWEGRVQAVSRTAFAAVQIVFSRKADRDHAKEWALRFAAERGLDATGIN